MPLSSNSQFGVVPLTQAINRLPVTPTIIRSLGIFAPKPLTTTYVRVENKNGALRLVKAVPRNAAG
ncbi:MAG: major capsid protein, partial [Cardiobacterium sp.]